MVYMLLGTGFEETEAIAPLDLLRRAGVEVQTVGLNGKVIYGSHGIGVEADIEIGEMDLTNMEMIILPGGLGGVTSVRASMFQLFYYFNLNVVFKSCLSCSYDNVAVIQAADDFISVTHSYTEFHWGVTYCVIFI